MAGGSSSEQSKQSLLVKSKTALCVRGLPAIWYLAVHGDVKADAVEFHQAPVGPPLRVPVVRGRSVGDTLDKARETTTILHRQGEGGGLLPEPHDSHGYYVPAHTLPPPADRAVSDACAATSPKLGFGSRLLLTTQLRSTAL